MKRCSTCKETKDFSEFSKNKNHKDGLQYKCKACNKQYRQDNKRKIAEYKKQYCDNNKAKIAEYGKQHRDNNKDYYAKYKKLRRLNTIPCVYRIMSKTSGIYYIGSTTQPLCDRITHHFIKGSCIGSPFTGKDRNNWEVHQLCTGTKEQVRELEKYLLKLRVGIDKNCINKQTW